jgi:hypothetical protein
MHERALKKEKGKRKKAKNHFRSFLICVNRGEIDAEQTQEKSGSDRPRDTRRIVSLNPLGIIVVFTQRSLKATNLIGRGQIRFGLTPV